MQKELEEREEDGISLIGTVSINTKVKIG